MVGAQIGQTVLARSVHQGVLVDPAETRGVGAQFGGHAFGQTGKHAGEILGRSGAGPVEIGSILVDDVDIRVAEIGEATDGLDPRRAEHGADDGIGDLVLDNVRTAVPAGKDDDLSVGKIGRGVQGERGHGPPSRDARGNGKDNHGQLVLYREVDDPVNHRRLPGAWPSRP